MKFPNAAKGISKIFTAEILYLIAAIAAGVASIFVAVMTTSADSGDVGVFGGTGIGAVACAAVAGVLTVIALILSIVGVFQTSKDEPSFKIVLYITIINLVLAFVGGFLSGNAFVSNIIRVVTDVLNLISSALIILGIANMANQLGNMTVINKGGTIIRLFIFIGLLSIIARVVGFFLPNTVGVIIVISLGITSMIFSIIQYFVYLSFLSKAKKMLAE